MRGPGTYPTSTQGRFRALGPAGGGLMGGRHVGLAPEPLEPAPPPAAHRASVEDKKALVDKVDCFIFDCDGAQAQPPRAQRSGGGGGGGRGAGAGRRAHRGRPRYSCTLSHTACCTGVIWRGDSLIEGIPETLDMLRSMVSAPR
jgi:hypothetical protein